MSTDTDSRGTFYHIGVKANLEPNWADWFEGFVLASRGDGETILSGRVTDQAALHGMLSRINSLAIPLVLVVQVDHFFGGRCCPLCGHPMDLDKVSI